MDKNNPIMISQTPLVQFGPGVMKNLGRQARFLNMRKALVVTDEGIRRLGILERVREGLESAGVATEIYSDVQVNPTDADVAAGVELFKRAGCDAVVAVGGGSPIDAGKAIRVLARCGGSTEDYDITKGGIRKIPWDLPSMIAVPTTAGTGSEVTNAAVITIQELREKISVLGAVLMPTFALVDPEMSALMPASLTAATGMDALAHCIESYCVDRYCPPADQAALGGMELVGRSLERAVRDGNDMDARIDMAMAALLGGMSFPQKGVGAAHALSHPLSAAFGVPHGLANAIMLPYVMETNRPCVSAKLERIAACLTPDTRRAHDAAGIVRGLSKEIGLPQRLSEVGVKEDAFDLLAQRAAKDISLSGNPVRLSVEELKTLYLRAF